MKYRTVRLGDVAKITMGQSPKSEYYNSNKIGIPFLQGVRTFGDNFPVIDTYTTEYKKTSKKGDILFSVRAPVGNVNWSQSEIAIGRGIAAISVNKEFDPTYFYYYFKEYGQSLDKLASGTVFTSINKSELSNLKLRIPELLKMQKQISNQLSILDKKIETNRRINDNLVA